MTRIQSSNTTSLDGIPSNSSTEAISTARAFSQDYYLRDLLTLMLVETIGTRIYV